MTSYGDVFELNVPQEVAQQVWDYLENGRPRVAQLVGQSYTDAVMQHLNAILDGRGVRTLGLLSWVELPEGDKTVVYDDGLGEYRVELPPA